jgi:NhaA family Na+:H+ antiporter
MSTSGSLRSAEGRPVSSGGRRPGPDEADILGARRSRETVLTSTEPRSLVARFIRSEAAGSVLLLAATLVALAVANSPWGEAYERLLHASIGLTVAGRTFALSLQHWVNDGLMAVFFFVVGLEIKRELVLGQLSTLRGAILPVAAAAGGMVVPALLFAALNAGGPGARAWGVPMATDIAFALGVLALLGRRVPLGLKVFLTALAIADDLGAVLVIALYYTARIDAAALAVAGALLAVLALVRRRRMPVAVYGILGAGVWAATLASGVHATVAGILLALLVPVRSQISPDRFLSEVGEAIRDLEGAPLSRETLVLDAARLERLEALHEAAGRFRPPGIVLEHALHPVTTWFVLPAFALFNAGVRLEGGLREPLGTPVALGVVLGLFVGKLVGITGASWLVVRLRLADLPEGVRMAHLLGAATLGGIGFTMSIFVAGLALGEGALVTAAKAGILAASAISAAAGYVFLRLSLRSPARD